MTVFALSWGTARLGYTREQFLWIQLFGILFFALTIPWSATMAERGRRGTLMRVNLAIFTFGLVMAPMFEAGVFCAVAAMGLGMSLVGLGYCPRCPGVSEPFPTSLRYPT